jgi:hypothetical protein
VVATMLDGTAQLQANGALAFVAAYEPEELLPYLAFQRDSDVLRAAAPLLAPAYERFLSPAGAERLAEWVARIALSYLCSPSDTLDLRDAAQVRALVEDFVLPGITRVDLEGVHR